MIMGYCYEKIGSQIEKYAIFYILICSGHFSWSSIGRFDLVSKKFYLFHAYPMLCLSREQ